MSHISLSSPAFGHEQPIPMKYSCEGDNVSPPLAIDQAPASTETLALIVDDPDAPNGTWDHWVVFNIPPDTTRIGEGDEPQGVPGSNSWDTTGYGGPCPPSGQHRYMFHIFALDTTLELPEGASKADVLEALEGHVIDEAILEGTYIKQQ
jgi:Raf kinase inhibitor-like YbhB/YbcL family protein